MFPESKLALEDSHFLIYTAEIPADTIQTNKKNEFSKLHWWKLNQLVDRSGDKSPIPTNYESCLSFLDGDLISHCDSFCEREPKVRWDFIF